MKAMRRAIVSDICLNCRQRLQQTEVHFIEKKYTCGPTPEGVPVEVDAPEVDSDTQSRA